jgi:hypothetical protein
LTTSSTATASTATEEQPRINKLRWNHNKRASSSISISYDIIKNDTVYLIDYTGFGI